MSHASRQRVIALLSLVTSASLGSPCLAQVRVEHPKADAPPAKSARTSDVKDPKAIISPRTTGAIEKPPASTHPVAPKTGRVFEGEPVDEHGMRPQYELPAFLRKDLNDEQDHSHPGVSEIHREFHGPFSGREVFCHRYPFLCWLEENSRVQRP